MQRAAEVIAVVVGVSTLAGDRKPGGRSLIVLIHFALAEPQPPELQQVAGPGVADTAAASEAVEQVQGLEPFVAGSDYS